jgi:L,D-transpeptidase YbiS
MYKSYEPRSGNGTRFFFVSPLCLSSILVPVPALLLFLVLLFSNISLFAKGKSDNAGIRMLNARVDSLEHEIRVLQAEFNRLKPDKPYLLVNSTANELRLMDGEKVLCKAVCSTGSYILLKAYGDRKWLFKTPRGRFKVNVKLKDPWWYKPDWAYIEEGLPVPSIYSPKRYEPGVLGDYALGFGNGYLIHGTLYTRFLGMPITHGCVRLGDQDMELVFKTMSHGYKIYIY